MTALFAVDRLDSWVIRFSIGIAVVCVAGVVLWQFALYMARKLAPERKALRQSPEPVQRDTDPERLERTCAGLAEALAASYLKLAETWEKRGEQHKAVAVLQKLVDQCPETRQAQIARDRLNQLGAIEKHI